MRGERNLHSAHLIAVARKLLERLPDPDIRAAFLFGSPAWGDADEASDIDVMLLLDRLPGYREVTRVRIEDLLGYALPDGPRFADLDRISSEAFAEVVGSGGWGHRVARSVVLKDTDGFYEAIRERVSAEHFSPRAREGRFLKKRERAEAQIASARETPDDDGDLAALHARLAIEEAGAALIELNDDRLSVTHFVESVERALLALGAGHLFEPFLRALSLDAPAEYAQRNVGAYRAFAEALKSWVEDPDIAGGLSQEDLAWTAFAYGEQSFEEIEHKVRIFQRQGRTPTLLYYLDGQLMVPIRIPASKILALRSTGEASRMSIPEFQVALRREPDLYDQWISALRLHPSADRVREAGELVGALLQSGDIAVRRGAEG